MHELLQSLGLSKSEALVYSALSKQGASKASHLTQATGIYRTNLYDILAKLEQQGLVRSLVRNRVRTWIAAEPQALARLLDKQERRLHSARQAYGTYLKELQSAAVRDSKDISIYQDRDGLRYFYERLVDMAESDDDLLVIGSSGTIMDVFNYYILNLSKRIRQIKVRARMIVSRSTLAWPIVKRVVKLAKVSLRQLPGSYVSPIAVFVFRDHVGFCNFMESPFVIMVKSKRFADSYREHFEKLWKLASPEDVLD